MKKQYLADRLTFLILLSCFVFLFTSCRTTAGTEHDEIVATAIQLADEQIKQNMAEAALETYNRAISEAEDYRLTYNKAIVLGLLGRYDEAAETCAAGFQETSRMDFKTAQAKYLAASGNREKTAEVYREILEIDPYSKDTRLQLIDLLFILRQPQEAYEQALILWDQNFTDTDTRTKVLSHLYKVNPDEWEILYTLLVPEGEQIRQAEEAALAALMEKNRTINPALSEEQYSKDGTYGYPNSGMYFSEI